MGMTDDEDFDAFRNRLLADSVRWRGIAPSEIEQKIAWAWRGELERRSDREDRRLTTIAERFPARALETARRAELEAPALAHIRAWTITHADGLAVLAGAPGCGKTTAATWWALQQRGAPAPAFMRATEFAAGSRYDVTARARWASSRALVLDDLGAEYSDARGSFRVDLDELVDVYYADNRTLIITTNLAADEFRDRYGERVVDRMRECGAWLAIAGGSLRGGR